MFSAKHIVEIQTKVASVIPFVLGTLYSIYRFGRFNLRNFIILFIALISFDMVTTAINNYYDYKKAHKTHGYGYESHNAIVSYKLRKQAWLKLQSEGSALYIPAFNIQSIVLYSLY
ncbi:MAG: hypothetical protein ACYCYE_09305 [Clostridia bacterium]